MASNTACFPGRSNSKEAILKALQSWGKLCAFVRMRRDAALQHEELPWFFALGQFEFRKNGWCVAWNPDVSPLNDCVLEEGDRRSQEVKEAFSASHDGWIIIPPPVLRCSVCRHIFRGVTPERIHRVRSFVSLERFVGVSIRRVIGRLSNPTNRVYGIPLRTRLQNDQKIVAVDFLGEGNLDRTVCGGDFLEMDLFRFSHEGCETEKTGDLASSALQPMRVWFRGYASDPENVFQKSQPRGTECPSESSLSEKRKNINGKSRVREEASADTFSRKERAGSRPHHVKLRKPRKPSGSRPVRNNVIHEGAAFGGRAWYREKVESFPLLDKEEERVLAVKAGCGDRDAIHALVSANLRLSSFVALRFWSRHPKVAAMDLDDCVQEANAALLMAAQRFDSREGVRFSSYAIPYINGCLQGAYAEVSSAISIPKDLHWKFVKFGKSMERFLEVFGREEAVIRAAADAKISVKAAREFAGMCLAGVVSFDAELEDTDDMSLSDILPDRKPSARSLCFAEERQRIVRNAVNSLPRRQRDVLSGRFGIFDDTERTLESLGQATNVTRERVRQIESAGKRSLREELE